MRKDKIFNDVNGYSLDSDQIKAVLSNKENTLVIAGAGSGKTLTIIGKIRYLIEREGISSDEILCISFTNACTDNLKKILEKYNYNIDVFTFHKLSLNIIKNSNNNISICDEYLLEYIINEFFYRNIKNKKLLYTDEYKSLVKLISTFINLFKSNNYKEDKFNEILKSLKYGSKYVLI